MAQANKADEPSMEEILASIRRIISDEEPQAGEAEAAGDEAGAGSDDNPVEIEAADDMGDASEMSQDDLDKLFDMDGDDPVVAEEEADEDMAAAMAAEAEDDDVEAEVVTEEPEDDEVLELTEDFALSEDDIVTGEPDIEFAAAEEEPLDEDPVFAPEPEVAPAPAAVAKPKAAPKQAPLPSSFDTQPVSLDNLPDVDEDDVLTSDTTDAAVDAALGNLASMFIGSRAQTLEELVQEMLRPMIKIWLDQNLPGMVEQMVKKEIERVAKRRK
ncbi:MAG: DUF2497 domain-containing protein [Rhodobacteraceae bacterium]|nr:DUF2497 domain-containing protein [Paracoccaceae bacterium]